MSIAGSDKKSAKGSLDQIPYEINEYIKNKHFDEEILTEIRKDIDSKGQTIYNVEISHDETLYKMQFNVEGVLMKQETEPLFKYEDDEYGVVD
ncbi:MAG: hypothetical protein K8R85_04685 [Bacteroidetes bacterium]|nr:hypothetical protein [Bacteroidota bacterium]